MRPLAEYPKDLKKDEVLVVMKRRRPIAAVVALHDMDRESVALSFHPKFLAIIEKSRADIAAGRTFTMDEVARGVAPEALEADGSRVLPDETGCPATENGQNVSAETSI